MKAREHQNRNNVTDYLPLAEKNYQSDKLCYGSDY